MYTPKKRMTDADSKKDEIIRKSFYDPEIGFQGTDKLFDKLKEQGITRKEIREWRKKQEVYQLHYRKPPVRRFFPIVARDVNHIWQADLMDMGDTYKKQN